MYPFVCIVQNLYVLITHAEVLRFWLQHPHMGNQLVNFKGYGVPSKVVLTGVLRMALAYSPDIAKAILRSP
jgi:hypothetical protein